MEWLALNSFSTMLFAAFLGGLILNFMPCVLPVLAIKFHSLTALAPKPNKSRGLKSHGLESRGLKSRGLESLWIVLGILLAFNAFALLIYILQQAGAVIGWGFHFQQPVFVMVMMSLLLFFAWWQLGRLNFNLGTEEFAHHVLNRVGRHKKTENLFYGALIVLLATPCTAPFLGSAVAFALTQGLSTIFAIFTAIAFGLATPWILFGILFGTLSAHFPQGASKMLASVKNNNFTRVFHYVIVLFLYGSALWLLSVLAQQIGAAQALAIFAGVHLILLSWKKWRFVPAFAAPAFVLLALIATSFFLPPAKEIPEKTLQTNLNWQPFNPAQIERQQALGKKVFVDITAQWCLTCQYNKANVLSDRAVVARLSRQDVYLMQGDLTTPQADITRFLQRHNRIGIPFNALYDKKGVYVFSELLDKKILLERLNKK